jgi:hypothetical protein
LNLSRNSWIRYAISKELEHSEWCWYSFARSLSNYLRNQLIIKD